jgi:hypothetical protein
MLAVVGTKSGGSSSAARAVHTVGGRGNWMQEHGVVQGTVIRRRAVVNDADNSPGG